MAWSYVCALPTWDEAIHNILRKECFKILSLNARIALRTGGSKLGTERLATFKNKIKSMVADYDDIGKCQETLNFLVN